MNKFARSLATLAVAAAVIPTAAALVPAREGLARQVKVAITTRTVETQKVEEKAAETKSKVVEKAQIVDEVNVITSGKVEAKEQAKPAAKAEAKDEAKAAVKVEKKAAVVNRRGAPPQQNLDPWIQQMTPQLRPMIRAQLHLIAATCSPTPEQRKEFSAEGERVLKDVARDCAAMQMGQHQGKTMSDPNKLIAEALGVVLKDKLKPEQWARFEAETRARAEARKRLVVQNLVSSLDDELVLAPDQRAAIIAAMEKNYDESWCSTLQVLMYGTQFFPNVPNNLIEPILTPNQKLAWNKRARNGTMAWWNFGHNGNAVLLDDDFDAAPAPAPAPAPADLRKGK